MMNLQTIFRNVVILSILLLPACRKRQPESVYPKQGFRIGTLAPADVMNVEVLFGEETPTCEYQEIATILYDWAKDGAFTSQSMVYDGLRRAAANIGAHGLYKVEISNGAHLSMGVGMGNTSTTGDATISGSTIRGSSDSLSTAFGLGTSAREVGGIAVAYICTSEQQQTATLPVRP